jgi:DNA-directed RNA polymerase specialized sigma24 family protein
MRRAGGAMTLDTQAAVGLPSDAAEVLRVHEALAALHAAEPRLAQVVEMRYFGGYTEPEIGAALGLTERTVRRDWDKARLMLLALLR